jgi:tRNA-splicing ligase RtcB
LGFDSHNDQQEMGHLDRKLNAKSLQDLFDRASKQLGTLGGGNHFMEAQQDEEGYIWFMVHSGSRHIGFQIAKHYNDAARKLNNKNKEVTPQNLWFLHFNSQEGQNYYNDMSWAIDYALENRWRMLQSCVDSFFEQLNKATKDVRKDGINIHHNFANIEEHFDEEVIIHRKGATQAEYNQIGIIPGTMGTASYIVKGKGNPESYKSCSHGAGRVMSRTEAKRTIKKEQLEKSMKDTFSQAQMKFVDEAPGAYKDISDVIENQQDLIEVLYKLKPIITLKG